MAHPVSAIETALEEISRAHVSFDEERIRRALTLAQQLYAGRSHWTGIPLLEHVLQVLKILIPFEPDEDAVIACLLHHVLDTREISLLELEDQFGPKVRALISGVHLLAHVTLKDRRSSIEDLRLTLLSVSDDVRVILIILCDRCVLLEQLPDLSMEDGKMVCRDVLQLLAPVAARLGIHVLKQRLEHHAFPFVYPSDAERIQEQLEDVRRRCGSFLDDAAALLARALRAHGIPAQVQGREKHPYSIFLKMKTKSLSHIDHLSDLWALRCIVETEEECYRVLGVLHRMGRPVANRFKDHIAFPKPNGYQSLHTTMARLPGVPEGVFIEVQVRTEEMHREAEYGIAAHWSYKEGGTTQQVAQRVQLNRVLAHQHLIDGESLADHMFVLTPRGDVIELPEGATPLDFAFQIHTDLGLSFRAARVNGSIVPLDHELENGDLVEIIRHKTPKPSPEWIQLLKLASARTRLKRYFYTQDRGYYVARGRSLVNTELLKRTLPILGPDLSLLKLYDDRALSVEEREDLLVKIGQGAERASALLPHLGTLRGREFSRTAQVPHRVRRLQRKDVLIEMEGGLQMPMRFAKCCMPQEERGQPIVGVITRSGQVTIHREKCHMRKNANPERQISVWWRDL